LSKEKLFHIVGKVEVTSLLQMIVDGLGIDRSGISIYDTGRAGQTKISRQNGQLSIKANPGEDPNEPRRICP
jgi:hypothetical protein